MPGGYSLRTRSRDKKETFPANGQDENFVLNLDDLKKISRTQSNIQSDFATENPTNIFGPQFLEP